MKEGSKAEVLGKTIAKFINDNPIVNDLTVMEFYQMLATVAAVSLFTQTRGLTYESQKDLGVEYSKLFLGIFNELMEKHR